MHLSVLNRISGLSQVPDEEQGEDATIWLEPDFGIISSSDVKHGGDEPICLEPDFGIKSRSRCGTGKGCLDQWTG